MISLDSERQRAVLDAAMQLFATLQLSEISLGDADAGPRACRAFDIIRHYQSSENILRSVLERELEMMAAVAQEPELRMPGETLKDEFARPGRRDPRSIPAAGPVSDEAVDRKR